jgi:LPS sulfotransferase NodH
MIPKKTILVCSTPRSGTTWLCDIIASTGSLGYPGEYFTAIQNEYYERLLGRKTVECYPAVFDLIVRIGSTPNGTFSTKLFWNFLESIAFSFHNDGVHLDKDGLSILEYHLPNIKVIRLTRKNRIRQAISHYRAIQTNIWWKNKTVPVDQSLATAFDFQAIQLAKHKISRQENAWTSRLTVLDAPIIDITYEGFLENRDETIAALAEFLECSALEKSFPMSSDFEMQADKITDEWEYKFNLLDNGTFLDQSLVT